MTIERTPLTMGNIRKRLHRFATDRRFSDIFTGSAWVLGARVFTAFFGLANSVIIARFYGADVVGLVAVVNSFLLLATIFTVFGTRVSIIRLIPEHMVKYSGTSAYYVYRKTLIAVICASLVSGTIFFFLSGSIASGIFSKPHMRFYLSLAAVFIVFKSMFILNSQAVRGLKLIKTYALMQFLPTLINLALLVCLTLFFYRKDIPVYSMLFSFTIAGIIAFFIMEIGFRRKMRPGDPVRKIPLKEIISLSFPMFMTGTMSYIIGQTGVIVLGAFHDESVVGFYAIAFKLATLNFFIFRAVNTVSGPRFSELFHSGQVDEMFYVAKKSAKLIFWCTFPIFLGLVLMGRPILSHVYGSSFSSAYPAMVLLLCGQFIKSITGPTSIVLNMTGHHKFLFNISFITALCNIALNVLLVPAFGTMGAAASAMASAAFLNGASVFYIQKKFGRNICYLPGL